MPIVISMMRAILLKIQRNARSLVLIAVFNLTVWFIYTRESGSLNGSDTSNEIAFNEMKAFEELKSAWWGGPQKPRMGEGLGNFEPPADQNRTGPGEGGRAHKLSGNRTTESESSRYKYGMNMIVSDEIPLNRSIPDLRDVECQRWIYPEGLPNASVVVVFHNEGFSTLMRTVHSVINRTPPQLLEEIILVDDDSDYEDLKDNLDSYVQRLSSKVRVIHNDERQGLSNTRSRGAREARGEVIVFLDAHCEVNKNWLPPLLAPILYDRATMTVPIIDTIHDDTFEIHSQYMESHHFKGVFDWGMNYNEMHISNTDKLFRKHRTEPYRSPTHAGGLFAINREHFLELGAYDPGLLGWGGENLELSFKVWQCGGRLLWVPCSRVGHVYKRGRRNHGLGNLPRKRRGDLVLSNYKRVVETWMDDKHKEFFYATEPFTRYLDVGNITDQIKLKERLNCKSFSWFMAAIAYDLTTRFPEPPPNLYWGHMKNVGTQTCLDPYSSLEVKHCYGHDRDHVRLNAKGQLGIGPQCVDVVSNKTMKLDCLGKVDGPWQYDNTTKLMYHKLKQQCIAVDRNHTTVMYLEKCDQNNTYQQWFFVELRPT